MEKHLSSSSRSLARSRSRFRGVNPLVVTFARVGMASLWVGLCSFLLLTFCVAAQGFAAESGQSKPRLVFLVVDKSHSIGKIKVHVVGAVTQFAGNLETSSKLGLVFFGNRATSSSYWGSPMDTRAKGEFITRFQKEFQPTGQTLLFDTVGDVLDEISANRSTYGSVEVMVLSDGVDNLSERWQTWAALCDKTKKFVADGKSSITWFTLGFDPGSNRPSAGCGVVVKAFPDPSTFSIAAAPALAKPVAAFEAEPRIAKPGQVITFKLLVSSGVTAAQWNYGDGTSGSGVQTAHAYSKTGTFSPKVEVTGVAGNDSLERPNHIQIVPKVAASATFTVSPKSAKVGEEILFSLESGAGVESLTWSFGDGQTVSAKAAESLNVRHAYNAAGKYTIRAEAQGPDGGDTSEVTGLVNISTELPVSASFSASPHKAVVGDEVLFTLNEAAGVSKANWDFGDGTTSSNIVAKHAYQKQGDYDITASVEGPGGKDTVVLPKLVAIRAEVPLEAVFSWAPKTVIAGQEVQFIDESVGGPTKWLWEIPGSGTRPERNPVIVFSKPETVLVRLTVEKDGLQRSMSKEILVTNPPPPLLQARFEVAPTNGRCPLKVQFKDKSKGLIASYKWDFGDKHTESRKEPSHTYEWPDESANRSTWNPVDIVKRLKNAWSGNGKTFSPKLVVINTLGETSKNYYEVTITVVPPVLKEDLIAALGVLAIVLGLIIWRIIYVKTNLPLEGSIALDASGTGKVFFTGRSFDLTKLCNGDKKLTKKCVVRNTKTDGMHVVSGGDMTKLEPGTISIPREDQAFYYFPPQ